LLTPLEDVTVSLPVDDTHVNSQTVAKQQQQMDAVGVVFYLLASLTCLVVSCAAALDALERTASVTLIPVSFLITIVLPLATSLITTASLTAASINTKAGHKAAPNYLALNIAIQYTLHTGITLLLALFPLLQLFSGGNLLYTRFSVVGTGGRVVTLLAANAALTSGHANWMIGATLLCIYLALATAFFAHSSTDL
jgi:Ca2+/H+ antiporter